MRGFRSRPAAGRVFSARRRVRSTDVTPAGRLRLDALARYLQDVAEDDLADAGWSEPGAWLARRTAIRVQGFPARGDVIRLDTFCSGLGASWAERTTTLSTPDGTDVLQATAIWAVIRLRDSRPAGLGPQFTGIYGEAAGGRTVSARLSGPPPAPAVAAQAVPWPVRAADFDMAGHVNNTVYWAVAEDLLAGLDWLPGTAELEYHRPILPGAAPSLAAAPGEDSMSFWLLAESGHRLASGRLASPACPAAPET